VVCPDKLFDLFESLKRDKVVFTIATSLLGHEGHYYNENTFATLKMSNKFMGGPEV